MKTKTLLVLTMTWLIVGIAASATTNTLICERAPAQTACQGDPQAPFVTVHTKRFFSKKLKFTPRCVNAAPGTQIAFRLLPAKNNSKGSAEIFADKPAEAPWLAGKNIDNKDFIFIEVPAGITPRDHKFNFKTNDKCIDPRVNVQN